MQRFEVEYFEKEDGTYPAEEFILSQDVKMRAKLFRLLELLEEKEIPSGNLIPNPWMMEFLKSGQNRAAISPAFCIFFYIGNKIILTNGFIKKSQKTPPSEIDLAKKYRAEYEKRLV